MALLEVEGLEVGFPVSRGWLSRAPRVVRAVAGVDLVLAPGETVAVVGESGCGKTTLARAVLGLTRPSAGAVRFGGVDIAGLDAAGLLAYRRQVQMVFQDPFDSLNPRKTVFQTLALPLRVHRIVPEAGMRVEAARLLDLVGLSPGSAMLDRYPHQFSGGQRQRVCIARALAVRPSVIVTDEAVSALDVSIRAQILGLLRRLQAELGLAYLFITHDLGVVRSVADRVSVMYLGRIVEEGPAEALFAQPLHPYTLGLIAASPIADPVLARARQAPVPEGEPPSPLAPPAGCTFHPRCPVARDVCAVEAPALTRFAGGQASRCHFAAEAGQWARPAHLGGGERGLVVPV